MNIDLNASGKENYGSFQWIFVLIQCAPHCFVYRNLHQTTANDPPTSASSLIFMFPSSVQEVHGHFSVRIRFKRVRCDGACYLHY